MIWKRPDITPHAVSPKLMHRSLERIVRLSPEYLACGHGLPMRLEDALPVIKKYLQMGNDKDSLHREVSIQI